MAKEKQIDFSQRVEKTIEDLKKKDNAKKSDLARRAATLYNHLYKEVSEQIQKASEPDFGGETEIVL
ncbi:MAG: hypothetical protein JSV25_04750 [Spirochaetota bacterium]|nr:MAG: hypothetical protein JSV25_04750 [Spirochaetota bacterium]